MTLADILEPASVVLAHAELKGVQIGGTVGALLAPPLLSLRPALINPQSDPPLVAVAKTAGAGALVASVVVTAGCLAKMASIDKEGIVHRADALRANKHERKLRAAAAGGVGLGLSLAALRCVKVAEADGVSIKDVVCTRDATWEAFGFAALGVAVCTGALEAGKVIAHRFGKVEDAGEEGVEMMKELADEAGAEAEKASEEAKEVAGQAGDKVQEVKEAVKDAAQESA